MGRLFEVEVQYLDEIIPINLINNASRPSSSKPLLNGKIINKDGTHLESHIRSLSEDRRYVSLRLGSLPAPENIDDLPYNKIEDIAITSKSEGK